MTQSHHQQRLNISEGNIKEQLKLKASKVVLTIVGCLILEEISSCGELEKLANLVQEIEWMNFILSLLSLSFSKESK